MPEGEPSQFPRAAVVTIQGGGIYGMNLLGQLRAVYNDHRIDPIALAGNSAGAILATLLWAGLTPDQILKRFLDLAKSRDGDVTDLTRLLGPSRAAGAAPRPFPYSKFIGVFDWLNGLVGATPERPRPVADLLRGLSFMVGALGLLALALLLAPALAGRLPAWHWRLIQAINVGLLIAFLVASVSLGWLAIVRPVFLLDVAWFVGRKGAFDGEHLMDVLDGWVREAILLRDPRVGLPDWRRLRFRDLMDLMRHDIEAAARGDGAAPAPSRFYFPPLFLTATNLTTMKLEILNSFEERYQDVEVAAAARASAGFPGVFRPLPIRGRPRGGWFVDGGVVSNFPAWVFADDFRRLMDDAEIEPYRHLASRPWANIGLRMTDDPHDDAGALGGHAYGPAPLAAGDYYSRLVRLATGLARDELENKLAGLTQRPILVKQPYARADGPSPEEMWYIHKVDPSLIGRMARSGYDAAVQQLDGLSFHLPAGDDRIAIEGVLEATARRAWRILGQASNDATRFRTNVFIPLGGSLRLCYRWNMGTPAVPDIDWDASFGFDRGHTGRCFRLRRPLIGNIREIFRLVAGGDEDVLAFYRTTPEDYRRVKRTMTWLASVPIFDPEVLYQRDDPDPVDPRAYFVAAERRLDGAILGVLNLDGEPDYLDGEPGPHPIGLAPRPVDQLRDDRVRAILAVMQDASFTIGQMLSRGFASMPGDRAVGDR